VNFSDGEVHDGACGHMAFRIVLSCGVVVASQEQKALYWLSLIKDRAMHTYVTGES